jgi:meso-butanediol dehydrogenase/(S,S)-butanediol dehydrogenase/diacetyl reductase
VSERDPFEIEGRSAIVTGAATGIGHGIAEHFARAGAKVLLCDVAEEGREVAERLTTEGHTAEFMTVDVSDPDQAASLTAAAVDRWGSLQILVNNAAVQVEKTIEDLAPDEWDGLMDVNLKGVYLCSRAAIPAMRSGGGGSIINIASVNGFWVEPGLGAYCAAKGGVITLTRSTAADFGRDAIRCNCICPGYIDTGMAGRYLDSQPDPEKARAEVATLHAVGRVGQPVDVAACARFLASDASSFVTGASFVVDGGLSLGVVARP